MTHRLNNVVVMVVAKLEAYQKIPINNDVKTYIGSFIENPGTAEQLANHLQSEYQDRQSFNFALYTAVEQLQERIVEERNKRKEEKSESLPTWETVSFELQENYLNTIIQEELEHYSDMTDSIQLDILNLKEVIYFKSDIIIIVPSLIQAKKLIDSVLDKASNQIEKLENIQALLFRIRHQEDDLEKSVYVKAFRLQFVPFIQLYDEYSFNLGEIKRLLFHYQESIYGNSYSKLTAPVSGNTFMWEGTSALLLKLFDKLKTHYISPETSFETFRLLFSATDIERMEEKISWVHTNVKNDEPNRLSLKSLIYALSQVGLIGRKYESNSRITYQILEGCFINKRGEAFREFRKSSVDFRSGASKEMLDLVRSIK